MKQRILYILTMLLMSVLLGSVIGMSVGVSPVAVTAGLMALSQLPIVEQGVLCMAWISVYKKKNGGRPEAKLDKIIFLRKKDILDFPERGSDGISITADILQNPGAYGIEIEVTGSTIEDKSKSEGENDAKGCMQEVSFERPGSDLKWESWLNSNMNEDLLMIIRRCNGSEPKLYGSPCNPLQFSFETADNKDKNATNMTVKSMMRGEMPARFTGKLVVDTDEGSGSGSESGELIDL